jgi:PHD/YefM family antitoxin component YafN of YafNO toxin-antitoxin module
MLLQDRFVSTTELQQSVSKTIDKAKTEDIIIIRNNKIEAAIIGINKYNEFLEYLEWKKANEKLDNIPVEYITEDEAKRINKKVELALNEPKFSIEDIEKLAEKKPGE